MIRALRANIAAKSLSGLVFLGLAFLTQVATAQTTTLPLAINNKTDTSNTAIVDLAIGSVRSNDSINSQRYIARIFKRVDQRTVTGIQLIRTTSLEAPNDIGIATRPDSPEVNLTALSLYAMRQVSKNISLSSNAIYRHSQYGDSYMLWIKTTVKTPTDITLSLAMRPSYDQIIHRWTNAVELGASYTIREQHVFHGRMLQTSRRAFEPAVRYLFDYSANISTNFTATVGAGFSNGNQYSFSEGSAALRYFFSRNLGVNASYIQKNGSLKQSNLSAGLSLRF